jgi:sulfoxide reductase heme-binding subunit YedZ
MTATLAAIRRTPPPMGLMGIRMGVFALAGLPAAMLVWGLVQGDLGVNPVETLLDTTGIWGLRFLVATLAITPIRWLTGATWLVRLRRQVGLWAFFYAAAHFTVFAVFDHSLALGPIIADIAKRPFILVGMTALLLMVPLAVTSTRGWIRRLGKRWRQLHWLVYPAAVLGLVHFFWLIRANRWTEPMIYAALLAIFLGWRLWRRRPAA